MCILILVDVFIWVFRTCLCRFSEREQAWLRASHGVCLWLHAYTRVCLPCRQEVRGGPGTGQGPVLALEK